MKCPKCNLESFIKTTPKENYLYQCDNCLSYIMFRNIVDKGDHFECTYKVVKFKTRELERKWRAKNIKNEMC